MKLNFLFRKVLIIGFLSVSACGFHLRGQGGFKVSSICVRSEAANRVASEVERSLIDQGVRVVSAPTEAQIVVYLRNETMAKRVLSVSAVSGKVKEVELNARVEIEVRKPDDSPLLEKQQISLLRDYSFDETAVLAMGTEEEVLSEELFRDSVAQIIRRLQAVTP